MFAIQHKLNVVYWSIRNWARYRRTRDRKLPTRRVHPISGDDARKYVSEVFLLTVGMRIVDNDHDIVHPDIYLTPIQREYKCMVEEYGFKVGLG